MAGDWIKMRTDLYRDPKVCCIADVLMEVDGELARFVSQHRQRDMSVTRNVMRNAVVGALVSVWGVSRQRGKRDGDDLLLRGVSVSVIDDMADMSGFGDAMSAVGWVIQDQNCLRFPHFFEDYNVDPVCESRSKNADRQRRFREGKRNVTRNVTVTSQSNTEESREEKSNKNPPTPETGESGNGQPKTKKAGPPPIPANLDTDTFRAAWADWLSHRREIKKPLKPTTEASQLKQLAAWGEPVAVASIRETIFKGWVGLVKTEPEQAKPSPSKTFEQARIEAIEKNRLSRERPKD